MIVSIGLPVVYSAAPIKPKDSLVSLEYAGPPMTLKSKFLLDLGLLESSNFLY